MKIFAILLAMFMCAVLAFAQQMSTTNEMMTTTNEMNATEIGTTTMVNEQSDLSQDDSQ